MKKLSLLSAFFLIALMNIHAQINSKTTGMDTLPVRGFCIGAPWPSGVDSFVTFIKKELAPRNVNTLILRIDYRYQFKSNPGLIDTAALSEKEVKKIVHACQQSGIQIIPQINFLGHQSWANHTGKLLRVYPQLDETPWIIMPEKYQWPNPENLYCKSYCPLYPGIHDILFPVMDELCDVFETKAFHAGMDEVFFIAEDKCPRCGGLDPATLFAGEVNAFRDHLKQKGRELWIWGDRLIDGKTTGMGEWDASMKNTWRAVDLISKDVIICDWHYDRADQSAVYFAMKGFNVLSCPYENTQTGIWQVEDMYRFRQRATPVMKDRFHGIIQTIWNRTDFFLKDYYSKGADTVLNPKSSVDCFKVVFSAINQH